MKLSEYCIKFYLIEFGGNEHIREYFSQALLKGNSFLIG